MARAEVNRSGEMEVFVQVVEQGGFSAAARSIGMTPSAVSKLVARLEARLGTRLVNRSTRAFKLTSEGCVFFEGPRVSWQTSKMPSGSPVLVRHPVAASA